MNKYILQLLSLLPFGSTPHSTLEKPKITASKPLLIMQIMERKAAERAAAKQAVASRQITVPVANLAVTRVRPSISIAKPKKAIAAPVKAQPSLNHILVELDQYVDCVFSCIKNFLSPNDKRKLGCFAKEIDACVANLDKNVLKPLESLKNNDPTAAHLYQLATVLKHNQRHFKDKLTGGYKNAMSLGMALMGLKNRAVKDVTKVLHSITPTIQTSALASQFVPIKKKIIALTDYGVNPMQAMKVLGKRF